MFDYITLLENISKLVSEYKNKTKDDIFMTVRVNGTQFKYDKIGFVSVDEYRDAVKSGDYFFVRDDGFVCSRAMDSFIMTSS